jgi:CheY-like chemotaxis protein
MAGSWSLTSIGCPDCSGVLSAREEGDTGLLVFRCTVGHTFSNESLIAAKEEQLESALWAAVELFREVALICGELAARAERGGPGAQPDTYACRIERARQHEAQLFPEQVSDTEARHLPIDHFFRSLALDQKDRAVGIVLSGTGTDATLGLKEIKGASGLTMAQEEASARYPGMPHSAISSLLIDHIIPPEEMPERLLAYARGALRRARGDDSQAEGDGAETLQRIFLLLRSRTGHDFSHYKVSTILRRIERRINVHSIEGLKGYLRYLQTNPAELDLLFKELLIGVTSFFRDPDAFAFLSESVVPTLIEGKPEDYVLRAWVPGCSTGEEAYSLAILLRECMERRVLLVEDNQDILDSLCALLEGEGYQVLTARDGYEGLEVALREHPEAILSDLGLPRLSGLDMARRLRPALPEARLVALSGRAEAVDRDAARQAGFDAYLVKPTDLGQLLQALG